MFCTFKGDKKITLFSFLVCSYSITSAQGFNNNLITGYASQFGHPDAGESIIDFSGGFPNVILNNMEMDFNQTHANISDTNDNLLFYTNGFYIADATADTILNGTGINPSVFSSMFLDGLTLPKANLIIPFPNNSDKFYILHGTVDDGIQSTADFLYYSVIDRNLNSGLEGILTKNQVIINSDLYAGKLAAVKHGNRRD